MIETLQNLPVYNTLCSYRDLIVKIERGKSTSPMRRVLGKNPDYLTHLRKEREKTEDNVEEESTK